MRLAIYARVSFERGSLELKVESRGGLLRNHPDRRQPSLHQLRPARYRKVRASQSERMPAPRIQMHLYGHSGFLERNVVGNRMEYVVHVVILSLEQKSRRRLPGYSNVRIQRQIFIHRCQRRE